MFADNIPLLNSDLTASFIGCQTDLLDPEVVISGMAGIKHPLRYFFSDQQDFPAL
jgi:hypothetical protein